MLSASSSGQSLRWSKLRARSARRAELLGASLAVAPVDRRVAVGGGSFRFRVPLVGQCACEPTEVMALYKQRHTRAGLPTQHLQDGLAGCAVDLDAGGRL
jgi:hypothetical protein